MDFFTAKAKYVAYGGARGGGKSWALRRKLVLMCLIYGGIRTLLIRRSLPELRENHIRTLQAELGDWSKFSETRMCFEFCNGSVLKLGYCCSENDVLQYQGTEYDIIAIDEATQFTEFQFQVLGACLRGTNSFPKRFYLTCNPGGVGHAWIKRLFIDRHYRAGEKSGDYCFIPARVYDNGALLSANPEYLDQLESLPKDLRRAWLDGDWESFSGQYFTEFDRDIHVRPIAPGSFADESPPRLYCAIDYGLDMLAVVFAAVYADGSAHIYDEVYKSGLIVSEAAKLILQKAHGVSVFIAPQDLWSRQKDSGKSIAELFGENGIWLTKLSSQRVDGWMCLKEWLKPYESESGVKKCLMTISPVCTNLLRCLPLLMHSKDVPGDVATIPHEITHAPDALRYFAVYRTCSPYREQATTQGVKLVDSLKKKGKRII